MKLAGDNLSQDFGWTGVSSLPELNDVQFVRWVTLLKERTGMRLPLERKSFLVTSLGLRMREIGFTDYQDYYDYVTTPSKGVVEWATLVDRLTVHETRFFRHLPTLELIHDLFLEPMEKPVGVPVSVNAWSIGCATGEEAYTLAILFDQYFEQHPGRSYYGVIGSDISTAALEVAREGIYNPRKLSNLEQDMRDKYFSMQADGRYQVSRSLCDRVCFSRINVLELSRAPQTNMDIIVCQNLLIYFDMQERFVVLDAMIEHLAPGGIIILGAGEVLGWEHPQMKRIQYKDTLAFRRNGETGQGTVK